MESNGRAKRAGTTFAAHIPDAVGGPCPNYAFHRGRVPGISGGHAKDRSFERALRAQAVALQRIVESHLSAPPPAATAPGSPITGAGAGEEKRGMASAAPVFPRTGSGTANGKRGMAPAGADCAYTGSFAGKGKRTAWKRQPVGAAALRIAGSASKKTYGPAVEGTVPHLAETATTLMFSIPCRLTQQELVDAICDMGFGDTFDFLHVPTRGHSNRGYAYVNFVEHAYAVAFAKALPRYTNKKDLSVQASHTQGRDANVLRNLNSKSAAYVRYP